MRFDKTMFLVLIQICILFAYFESQIIYLLPICVAVALIQLLLAKIGKKDNDSQLIAYAAALQERYSKSGSLIHSIEYAESLFRNQSNKIHRRYLLGDTNPELSLASNPIAKRLEELLKLGICSGRSIVKSLEEFCIRARYEMKMNNTINAKSGTMRSVTYMGLVFFLPLFGAIGGSIISLLSSSANAASLSSSLAFAFLVYIILALFITSYAYGNEESLASRIKNTVPLISIAGFVLFFASSVVASIL